MTQFVSFEEKAVQNNFRSEKEGRPFFEKKDYIRIKNAGSFDEFFQPWDSQTELFKEQHQSKYDAWKKSKEKQVDFEGTPVDQLPFLTITEIAELKAINILSVEALAEISESIILKTPFLRDKKIKAQAYLKNAVDSKMATSLASENEKLKEQLKEALQYSDELKARIRELESKSKKITKNKEE